MKASIRSSGPELLRIVAMYMIVFIHANMYLATFCSGGIRMFFNGLVNGICNIGVSCFILISGYYGVKWDLKKFIKMECMMITYSLLELLILRISSPDQMQGSALLEQLVKSFLPFITRKYWFYSCYVCLLLFSKYIQKFIDTLSKNEFQKLLYLLLLLFSVLPTIFYFELIPDNSKGLVQMIIVYMIGRYIRIYEDIPLPRKAGILFIILWIINGLSHEFPIQIGGIYHHLCKDNSITNLIMAVILFYLFKNLNFQSRFINRAAAYIFAVFALNNTLVSLIIEGISDINFQTPGGIAGFAILAGIVFLILVSCLLIGAVRELLLGKVDQKLICLATRFLRNPQHLNQNL